jgi:hypothetical protein
MTPEKLIDLLAEAGMLKEESAGVFDWHPTMAKAERFAALVTAAEREACAKVCDEEIKRVKPIYSVTAENCVKAIRARGQE